MDDKKTLAGEKDINFLKLIKNVNIKPGGSKKYKIDKESITQISQNLKSSIMKSIEKKPQQINDLISSLKKHKIRDLEKLLRVDKSQMIVSNRKNYIYRSDSGKMVIVDRDMWGDPCNVTIKENNHVIVKCIKFFEDKPYIFPLFNEKNVKGRVINMDANQIWYQDNNTVCVVTFKGTDAVFTNIQIDTLKNISKENLFSYIHNYISVNKNKKLAELVKGKGIRIEDIEKVRKSYVIGKLSGKSGYRVVMFDEEYTATNDFNIKGIPSVSDDGLDILFSEEILNYINANNYSFENFKQNDDHIEYWQQIGQKNVCVMRYKV
ncbi:MAG: hypothetical protein N2645_14645 [Clostridia bacterium]|nr:hypothetical protein [Clostridia bacterium]